MSYFDDRTDKDLSNPVHGQGTPGNDARRRSYHDYFCERKWGHADTYDLVLKENTVGIEHTAELIERYIAFRDAVEQTGGVGVVRLPFKHRLHRAALHHPARVHHGHGVAELGHHTQVVGDEHDGGVELLLQLAHQFQNLGLDGHIQGGGGFVGQQQFRLSHQGHGNDDALLHTAGKLVGEAPLPLRRDAHQGHHLIHPGRFFGFGHLRKVQVQHLQNLVTHGMGGVQAGHGVLEDHGDLLAPERQHFRLREGQQLFPVIPDGAAHHFAHPLRQQPEDGQGQGGLAGAGLPHKAPGLAPDQVQVEMVHRVYHRVVRVVLDGQIGYFKQIVFFHVLALNSSFSGRTRPGDRRQ